VTLAPDVDGLSASLTALHEQHVWRVNDAIGRDADLEVRALCDEYADAALRAIAESAPPARAARPAWER